MIRRFGKPIARVVVRVLPAWASNGWLTLRVTLGDWIIQLGHTVAGDPRCPIVGCKARFDESVLDYCPKHQSFLGAGYTPAQLEQRMRVTP